MTTKTLPIFLPGDQIAYIMAGPTRELPDDRLLVRCAEEIPADPSRVAVDIGTKDFQPFDPDKLTAGLPTIIRLLKEDYRLYVGCMGGTGRTGTLLAILAGQHPGMNGPDAIKYIRAIYKSGAVETAEQKEQVAEFSMTEEVRNLVETGLHLDPVPERPGFMERIGMGWLKRLLKAG
jgi:hypothetical protein